MRFVHRLLIVFSLLCLISPARAQNTDAILILDASGSMWGQIDGQTKITAAKKAVDSILSKWKPSDRLGLIAYGHRSKGDCRDIELMVPVSAFNPARIRDAVGGINPKGKTPIADSLRAAASALKSTEGKATVVLVSDGIETCVADPCAVAAELKKAGVGFVAHVIGFDVSDAVARNQLQCIARATGGIYLDAQNASGLENALGRAVDATQGARVQTDAPAKPAEDPLKGKNVRGVARLAAGLDPVSARDIGWLVHRSNVSGEKGEYVNRFDGSPFTGALDPGQYVMRVEYGQIAREVAFKVEKGQPATLDVVLDAGYVTSEGSVAGTSAKAETSTWEVRTAAGQWIATDYAPVPRFVLGAGSFVLSLSKGAAKIEKVFDLTAGDSINVSLTLDVGKLQVSGLYAPGGPKIENGFTVEVRRAKKADGQSGDWVATEYGPLPQFDLPSGSYEIVTSVGVAKRVTSADVTSGKTTRLDIVLDAGVAGIKMGNGKVLEILGTERDINNRRALFGTYYDPELNLALNAGDYIAVIGFADGAKVEKPFTVTAGKRIDVDVKR